MTDEKKRLYFIDEVRKSLTIDHNKRHSQKLEPNRFVRGAFEKELERRYPKVGTSELLSTARKAVISLKANPEMNRGMDFEKIDGLLKFIFTDHDASKWPTVVALVKSYEDGIYAKYAESTKTEEERDVDRMLTLLGDDSDKPTHVKLLRLYVEEALNYYKQNNQQMAKDRKAIAKMERRERELVSTITAMIKGLESQKELTAEDKKRVDELKKYVSTS